MAISVIISIVTLGAAIGASYYMWKRMSQMENSFDHLSKEISDIVIDSRLNNAFADGSLRNLDKIAKQIFEKTRTKFNIEADSYAKMAIELEHANLNKKFREVLSSFFKQMIQISYRGQNLSPEEISDLQKQIRLIIKTLQKPPSK